MRSLLLVLLCGLVLSFNSGIEFGIHSDIYKALTKIDFNKYLKDKIVLPHAETSGTWILNYEVKCDNLKITNAVGPETVNIETGTSPEGLPSVKLSLSEVKMSAILEYLFVKYGIIKSDFKQITGDVTVDGIKGEYYFNKKGEVTIVSFDVNIKDFNMDVKQSFLNWIIGLFKHVIQENVSKAISKTCDKISTAINNWVNGEFYYSLGYGIGFNLTSTMHPWLLPLEKQFNVPKVAKLLGEYFFGPKIFNYQSSILTFGIHGSCYPDSHPELKPEIEPAVQMHFNHDYFDNELQLLLSDYTINTLLYMGQATGMLHREFNQNVHTLFDDIKFDTQGFAAIFPEFTNVYGNKTLPVEMRVSVSVKNHKQPLFKSTMEGSKIILNFDYELYTTESDDPFDDPVRNLGVKLTAELPFKFTVDFDLLTVNWEGLKVTEINEIENNLKVSMDDVKVRIQKLWDEHVTTFLQSYTTSVAVPALLSILTGFQFHNLRLESKEGFLLASLGLNLDA